MPDYLFFLVYTVLHFPYTLVSLKVTNVHRCFRKKKHLMHADILCCLYIRLALNDKYLTIVTKRVFYATASFAVQVRWQPRWLYNDYEGVFFCLFVFLLFFLDLFSLRGYPHAKTMRKKRLDITPWRIFFPLLYCLCTKAVEILLRLFVACFPQVEAKGPLLFYFTLYWLTRVAFFYSLDCVAGVLHCYPLCCVLSTGERHQLVLRKLLKRARIVFFFVYTEKFVTNPRNFSFLNFEKYFVFPKSVC